MHELDGKHHARGLRVIAVTEVDPDDLADERANVAEVAKEHRIDYPCLLDENGSWMQSAGIEGVPTFLVIDRAGRTVYRYRGAVRPGSEGLSELTAAVERAL